MGFAIMASRQHSKGYVLGLSMLPLILSMLPLSLKIDLCHRLVLINTPRSPARFFDVSRRRANKQLPWTY